MSVSVCLCVCPFEVWMDRESADSAARTLKSLSCRCLTERISCQQVVYLQLRARVRGEADTWPLLMICGEGGTCTLLAPTTSVIKCGGWCIVSSQDSAPRRCYCNSLQASLVFSLLCNGLNGKHVAKSAVLLEGRKINQEERPPSSLCTPPSSMRCQEKFRSVTQRRQGSSLHINAFRPPPPPPLQHPQHTHTWFSFVGSEVRIIIIGSTWCSHSEGMAENTNGPVFRTPPPSWLTHLPETHYGFCWIPEETKVIKEPPPQVGGRLSLDPLLYRMQTCRWRFQINQIFFFLVPQHL